VLIQIQNPLQWLLKKCEEHDGNIDRPRQPNLIWYTALKDHRDEHQRQVRLNLCASDSPDGLSNERREFLSDYDRKAGFYKYIVEEHWIRGFHYEVADLKALNLAYQHVVKTHVTKPGLKRNVIVQICLSSVAQAALIDAGLVTALSICGTAEQAHFTTTHFTTGLESALNEIQNAYHYGLSALRTSFNFIPKDPKVVVQHPGPEGGFGILDFEDTSPAYNWLNALGNARIIGDTVDGSFPPTPAAVSSSRSINSDPFACP
jgi:hypothetical protein